MRHRTGLGRANPACCRENRTSGMPCLDYPCAVRCEARARRTPCRPVAAGRLVECPHPQGRTASVVQHVEPTDLTLWPTIRHVYPLWRAQWRLVTVGLVCALAFTGLSLLIPIIVQRTIDDAIDGGDSSLLVPYLT